MFKRHALTVAYYVPLKNIYIYFCEKNSIISVHPFFWGRPVHLHIWSVLIRKNTNTQFQTLSCCSVDSIQLSDSRAFRLLAFYYIFSSSLPTHPPSFPLSFSLSPLIFSLSLIRARTYTPNLSYSLPFLNINNVHSSKIYYAVCVCMI